VSMSHLVRTLVVTFAMEWELCSEDPFIFCYRMGVEPVRALLGKYSQPQ
jgi:hypothetical protein